MRQQVASAIVLERHNNEEVLGLTDSVSSPSPKKGKRMTLNREERFRRSANQREIPAVGHRGPAKNAGDKTAKPLPANPDDRGRAGGDPGRT